MNAKLASMRLTQPIIGRFPRPYYALARPFVWVVFNLRPRLRHKLIRNMLPLADGDRARARQLAFESCVNVCRYYVDLCTLPYRNVITFESTNLDLVGGERLAALAEAGPVVAVSAHTGSIARKSASRRAKPASPNRATPTSVPGYLARIGFVGCMQQEPEPCF